MLEDILIPIFAISFTFGAPALILWQLIDTRHRERKMVIERGLDPKAYAELFTRNKKATDPNRALKWGLLLTLVGGGLWVGSWMVQVYRFPEHTAFALMLIGGGLALALYYMIVRRPPQAPKD